MSVDKQIENVIAAICDNTAAIKQVSAALVRLANQPDGLEKLAARVKKGSPAENNTPAQTESTPPEKVSGKTQKNEVGSKASGAKAGLAPAPAPESEKKESTGEAASPTEEKPQEGKKQVVNFGDGESQKRERNKICQAVFGSLKSKLGASEAKHKVQEAIDNFVGKKGAKAVDDIGLDRHAEFVSYMEKFSKEVSHD